MGRKKVTVSLSSKCLELIKEYEQTTGLEARSRVIEEAIFAINELIAYKKIYNQEIQPTITKPNPSQSEVMSKIFMLMDTISKWSIVLDRFQRFPGPKYRAVPPEKRDQKPKKKRIRRE